MTLGLIVFVLIFFTIIASALSIAYYHRVWNPIFLMVIMFLLGSLIALTDNTARYLEDALFWILIGEIIFVFSFLLSQTVFNRRSTADYTIAVEYNYKTIDKLLSLNVLLAIISLMINIYTVMKVAPSFSEIFTNSTYVRYLYLQRESNSLITLVNWLVSFNFFTTFCLYPLSLQRESKKTAIKLIATLGIRLFSSLVTMSKEAFLIDIIIFVSAYILTVKNEKEERKFYRHYGLGILVLIIVLLVFISFQRNYIGTRYENYRQAVIGTLQSYVSISITAFGELLNTRSFHFMNGQLCFRPIFNILSYFGIGERQTIFQDAVVGTTNVYTVFGNMYRDFSYPGIVFLSIFFGLFLGLIYNTNYKYRLSNIVANSIVMMTMFFGYYDLKIIQTIYLFVMLYALVFDRIFKRYIYISE